MLKAQIHNKLPTQILELEDILTSDVFSFFLYSNKKLFLHEFLKRNGFIVSKQDSFNAEFLFWPKYEELTEPDLVIIVGHYYILIEAKFKSDFGKGSEKTKPQLIREIEGGMIEAKALNKQFSLLTITKDPFNRKEKFDILPNEHRLLIKWTNWQCVSSLLIELLENDFRIDLRDRLLADDLLRTLDKKNLRNYISLVTVLGHFKMMQSFKQIFLKAETIIYRGGFIGFLNSLVVAKKLIPLKGIYFSNKQLEYFNSVMQQKKLQKTGDNIFFNNHI